MPTKQDLKGTIMLTEYLKSQIRAVFPHVPTEDQARALDALSAFLASSQADAAFILRGYAGTGKTSLVAALVRTLDRLEQKCVLLAPTGRAAKVLASHAGHPAFTIHKRIYRQRAFSNDLSNFVLNDNLAAHTLFIVDEASMIPNEGLSGSAFGTGRLLDDLVHFVYSGQGCRLLLMGDQAQLPPVGEAESPALCAGMIRGYGLEVDEANLTQVVRQEKESGILWNATRLRQAIAQDELGHPTPQAATLGEIRVRRLVEQRHAQRGDAKDTALGRRAHRTGIIDANRHVPAMVDTGHQQIRHPVQHLVERQFHAIHRRTRTAINGQSLLFSPQGIFDGKRRGDRAAHTRAGAVRSEYHDIAQIPQTRGQLVNTFRRHSIVVRNQNQRSLVRHRLFSLK